MRRGTKALLCQEYLPGFHESPAFAIYLVDWNSPGNLPFRLVDRFSAVPEGLERIDIFDPPTLHSSRSRILGRTSIFSTRHPREGRVHFGVSLRSNDPPQEPIVAPPLATRASYESSRRSRSRSPSPPSTPVHYQDDRLRQRSRGREPSPRNRQPHRSQSSIRHSNTTTNSELLPSSWPLSREHETVEGPSMRERRRRSLPIIEVTYDIPNQPSQPHMGTMEIPPTPAVVIHPPPVSITRSRSRPVSMLSPLSLALRSSIRRRDSIDTPYQSDASSLVYQRRHSVEPPGEDLETDPQGHHQPTPPAAVPVSEPNNISQVQPLALDTDATTDILRGPWTRDLMSLHNLTTI
ncbi:hypothetical protein BDZ94DRAFT_1247691 [Collybia nuda]|uniref:Uncharacterized protein n=1 Tax=Collybia nuda TaxID=64659 RepID=A0A9P5YD43_9AGAR|nr:hypothetical protein BDZ94DRAFT_1247691 [Collybia nuda]